MRFGATVIAGCLLAVLPREAFAEDPQVPKADVKAIAAPAPEPTRDAADAALSRIIDRPHTIAEFEAGIIALPTAPISAGQSGGSTPFGTIGRGDATLQMGLHVLY